jgi:hypothetical protein
MHPPTTHLAALLEHWYQGAVLLALSLWSGIATLEGVVTEADWSKVFGPNGVAFVSSLATLTLWATGVIVVRQIRIDNIERENNRRKDSALLEDRLRADRKAHFDDLKESNKLIVERLISITQAGHEVALANSRTDMKVAESIHSLETQIQHLVSITPR